MAGEGVAAWFAWVLQLPEVRAHLEALAERPPAGLDYLALRRDVALIVERAHEQADHTSTTRRNDAARAAALPAESQWTVEEVAEYIGRSKRSAQHYAEEMGAVLIGRRLVFEPDRVKAWLACRSK